MSTAQAPAPARPTPPRSSQGGGHVSAPQIGTIDPVRLIQTYYPFLVGAAILGIVLGVAAFIVLKRVAPKYNGVATFQVFPVPRDAGDTSTAATGLGGDAEMERYMETEARVMVSEIILDRVVRERDVEQTKWAQQFREQGRFDHRAMLRAMEEITGARVVPDTTIITLSAKTSNRQDAPIIANTIKNVYLTDLKRREQSTQTQTLQDFRNQLRTLRSDIDALDTQMESVLSGASITTLDQRFEANQVEVNNLQPARVEVASELAETRERLEEFREMRNAPGSPIPESIRAAVEQSFIVQDQDRAIATQKARLRGLRAEYGPRHREVLRVDRAIKGLQQEREELVQRKIEEQFRATIEGLESQERALMEEEAVLLGKLEDAQRKLNELQVEIQRHEQLQNERDQKLAQVNELETRIRELSLLTERDPRVRLLSEAELPEEPAFPKLIVTVALSFLLVTGSVGGLIFFREIREQRVRGPHDVAMIPRTRVLGFLPHVSMDLSKPEQVERAARTSPQGAISESVRQLRTEIVKQMNLGGLKTLLVVSGLPGSGSSSVASNLAINAAAAELRVLVIDANIRRAAQHGIFSVRRGPGLGDVLLGESRVQDAIVRDPDEENLHVLPAGTRDARVYERFSTDTMRDVLSEIRDHYDLVIIDVPPAVVASDALSLANMCDATILVARAYGEKRGLVARLRNQLTDARATFLGVVVNAVRASAGGYFKRNFRATHEYVRLAEASDAKLEKKEQKKRRKKQAEDTEEQPPQDAGQSTATLTQDDAEVIDDTEISLDDLDLDEPDEDRDNPRGN